MSKRWEAEQSLQMLRKFNGNIPVHRGARRHMRTHYSLGVVVKTNNLVSRVWWCAGCELIIRTNKMINPDLGGPGDNI